MPQPELTIRDIYEPTAADAEPVMIGHSINWHGMSRANVSGTGEMFRDQLLSSPTVEETVISLDYGRNKLKGFAKLTGKVALGVGLGLGVVYVAQEAGLNPFNNSQSANVQQLASGPEVPDQIPNVSVDAAIQSHLADFTPVASGTPLLSAETNRGELTGAFINTTIAERSSQLTDEELAGLLKDETGSVNLQISKKAAGGNVDTVEWVIERKLAVIDGENIYKTGSNAGWQAVVSAGLANRNMVQDNEIVTVAPEAVSNLVTTLKQKDFKLSELAATKVNTQRQEKIKAQDEAEAKIKLDALLAEIQSFSSGRLDTAQPEVVKLTVDQVANNVTLDNESLVVNVPEDFALSGIFEMKAPAKDTNSVSFTLEQMDNSIPAQKTGRKIDVKVAVGESFDGKSFNEFRNNYAPELRVMLKLEKVDNRLFFHKLPEDEVNRLMGIDEDDLPSWVTWMLANSNPGNLDVFNARNWLLLAAFGSVIPLLAIILGRFRKKKEEEEAFVAGPILAGAHA